MTPSRPGGASTARDRGQTNLDFVIGIVLFVFAFSFVLAFLPQLVAPYEDQGSPLVAERASATLSESLLATDTPGVLDVDCTGAFFTGAGGGGCPFDPADPLTERLGVSSAYRVNVTLEWNVTGGPETEVLCYNGGDVGACGTGRLAAGQAVPDDHRSVAVERRTVLVDGRPVLLRVRVW